MATNTKNFKFKKPDESDFYDVQDQNGNWDMADEELEKLNAPTFEDYSGGALLPEASSAIDGIKSGFSLPTLLSNIKAAFKGACLLGHIVNNCVTNRSDLPLSAAQGKALMDMLTKLNGDLSFNYLYGYVASDLKLSDYPKDTRNIIPLEASDNSLGNLIELSDDKKWIVFKRNGRVRFNGCLSISWNNDFYLQVSVCRESNDSKGTPVPVVGVSIRSPLTQDNTFVYVDRVLRVKEGERLCFAFIIPNWCDTTGGFISRNSDRASSGLMANYVSFNDEMYV
jgi:hypothetical protein